MEKDAFPSASATTEIIASNVLPLFLETHFLSFTFPPAISFIAMSLVRFLPMLCRNLLSFHKANRQSRLVQE